MKLPAPYVRLVGRYALCEEIAVGGMAVVHVGRLVGAVGFSRIVAIKRLHANFARDPDFLSMFMDEARIVSRISHLNVVSMLDVVAEEGELFLVMEYISGDTLSRLAKAGIESGVTIPIPVAVAIGAGLLEGLHAAHQATDQHGTPLEIVHRDVSPQNLLVGADGIVRVLDFGIAKAVGRMQTTRNNELKGKLAYMAPEQLARAEVDRRTDVYAASIVLWECLTGERLFQGATEVEVLTEALAHRIDPPSAKNPRVPQALDRIVMQGLASRPEDRYPTARAMAEALRATGMAGDAEQVRSWVQAIPLASRVERETAVQHAERAPDLTSGLLPRHAALEQGERIRETLDRFSRDADAITSVLPSDPVALAPRAGAVAGSAASPHRIEGSPPRRRESYVRAAVAVAGVVGFGVLAFVHLKPSAADWEGVDVGHAAGLEPTSSPHSDRSPTPPALEPGPTSSQEFAGVSPPIAISAAEAPAIDEPLRAQDPALMAPPFLETSSAETPSAARRPAPKTPAKRAPVRSRDECDPPFVIDSVGVRIPKRQCL